jgi:flavorubredoxin
MVISVQDNIYWVGFVDWKIRDFHSYETTRGSTYNAYLLTDDKNVLVDTVKAPYASVLLNQVESKIPLSKLDYVICNHAEPDHSGSLPEVIRRCPNVEVICNAKCKDALQKHYDTSRWKFRLVEDGETINIGSRSLTFIDTPMVHWPESMFTYIPEQKVLFSMDAFGQHYSTSKRFDDEVNFTELMFEAKTYYANIVMLYGKPIEKVLGKASALEIEMIAPSHGVIWRSHLKEIITAYMDWVRCKPTSKVLILYDTMWESTEKMAYAIMEGAQPYAQTLVYHIRATNLTRLATEILDASAVALGSPTLNKTLMPQMAALLTYLYGLAPKGKVGFCFGSYGWSKGATKAIEEYMAKMNMEIIRESITSQYAPTSDVLATCREAGSQLAQKALDVVASFNNEL